MKRLIFLTMASIVVIAVTIMLSFDIVNELENYKVAKERIAEKLNFKSRLLSVDEWMSFMGGDSEEKLNEAQNLSFQADASYGRASVYSRILFLSVFSYLIVVFVAYFKSEFKNRYYGIALIVASFCFIYLGLQTPFLELEAANHNLSVDLGVFETEFEGDVYFFYQNKSVLQIIGLLFSGGNIIVGIALVLFSIIFPLFKLIASLIFLINPESRYSDRYVSIITRIGKWSMADVFVAAIFLAGFAFSNMNTGVDTASTTLSGLYFFMTFVLLSIFSGVFLKKAIQKD